MIGIVLIFNLILDIAFQFCRNGFFRLFPGIFYTKCITLCHKSGYVFRLVSLIVFRIKRLQFMKHVGIVAVRCENQFVIDKLVVCTGGRIPVCLRMAMFIVILHFPIDTILTGICRKCIGVKGPIRKIDSVKTFWSRTFFGKTRTKPFLFDPFFKETGSIFVIYLKRHNSSRCDRILIVCFHNLVGSAKWTDSRCLKGIVNGFCTTCLTNYGLLLYTPVFIRRFIH